MNKNFKKLVPNNEKTICKKQQQKLTGEETEALNNPMSIKEIEFIIENFFAMKAPGLNGFTFEFLLTFKGKIILTLHILFQIIEKAGTLPRWFLSRLK